MGVTLPGYLNEALDLIGVNWPNVDEDDYREMAQAMREFAEDIDDGTADAHAAISDLLGTNEGLAVQALERHWSKVKGTHLANLAEAGRLAATALDGVAVLIEGAKLAAIAQLGILAAEIAAAVAAAPVTLGLSTLGGLAATQATRIAVKRIFQEVCEEVAARVVDVAMGPVYQSLGSMAGDLVVQLGGNALGVQQGVDLGQTAQAGRQGLSDGSSSAMNLASADASGGRSGRFSLDPESYSQAGSRLAGAGGKIRDRAGGKLSRARATHGRTKGKDAIADAANAMLDRVIDGIEEGVKTSAKHLDTNMTAGLKKMARSHDDNDRNIASHLDGIRKGGEGNTSLRAPNAGTSTSPSSVTTGGQRGAGSKPLRDGAGRDEMGAAQPAQGRCKGGDPIDLVSGEMILTETDVELPGLLKLVIERTHVSSYRCGQWFGRSWASTLDQRLEADGDGLVFAVADGMLLIYPVPQPDVPVLPKHGPRWPLTWDGTPGGEISVTDPGTGHTLHFAPAAAPAPGTPAANRMTLLLHRVSDRNGHHIDIDRSEDGTPLEVWHSAGYRIAVDTDDHRVRALRLLDTDDGGPEGTVLRRYGYDVHGDLVEVVDAMGHAARFTYDGNGRIVERTDRNGGWYRWEYDGTDRCVRGTGADGFLSCTLEYDSAGRVNRYTDSLGHTTIYRYNEHRRLTGWTDALGNTTHREWDGPDRLLAATDALGRTTRYEYDEAGNTTAVIRPDGHAARAVYNDLGLPVEVTDVDGARWRYTYDERGNRLSVTDPVGATTRYSYEAHGHPAAVTDALGHTRRITTDAAGLPVALTDPLGHTTTVERDAFGRVRTFTDAAGRVERFGWTTEGRPAWHELADGALETWEWDGEGNLVSATDRAGGTSRFTYTHFHLPTSRTTPDGARHTFSHDTELRLTGLHAPSGRTWQYTYDAAGRLIHETDFAGRTLTYRPDPTGALAARTNSAGETVTYIRDILGRPVEEHSAEGISTYTYDLAGSLLRSANATTTVEHTYDLAGRKLSESINGRTTTWTYDALGRRTSRRTPSGTVSTWTYDAASRPTALDTEGHRLDFTFDDTGRETLRGLGPDLALAHDWDPAGRLGAQRIVRGTELLQHRQYTYRPDGFLTDIRDNAGTRHFDLTPAGRINAVEAHSWSESYAYDTTGNLTRADTPGAGGRAEPVRDYAAGRLHRSGRTTYTYDANGRLIRRHTRLLNGQTRTSTFTWNSDDRLTGAITADGAQWTYEYDAAGRRTAKRRLIADGRVAEETIFSWDGTRLAEQVTATGTVTTWDYHSGTHRPLTQVDRGPDGAPRFHAVVTDVSGAPSELITPDGAIAWQIRTTIWGLPLPGSSDGSTTHCPLRFPGQYADAETGWHYNYFRYYDPETARYVSHDPLGLAAAPNDYTYVDNPLTIADPLGLMPAINGPGGRWMRDPNSPVIQHNRDTEYPSSYRQSTHDAMAAQWTVEGQQQGGVPVYPAGHPSAGQRIPRDQLNWFDSNGNPVPSDQLTYEHMHPVVDHWNQTGYNTDRATRNDYYNDTNNMVPMTRSENSSGGGRMTATYRQDTGPNYSCS
ncbi:RHS repeat-associated core domain-containing protein [Streptomyces leeuwenhoekii]|uniref:RHS repeat-associated core domain-containing protein n=1 Tax=Streptomyces leeuwenhoekii TaxID=1437453 RepID=UPI00367C58AA